MDRATSLGIGFTVCLAMSAPVSAAVIVDNYNGFSWASAFVAHKEGGVGPFILDDVLVDDSQASTAQTFGLGTSALALASSTNNAGDEISSLVSSAQSLAVQRNGEQVSIVGAATTSIQGERPSTFFEANNSLGTYSSLNFSFTLTTSYEATLDFDWVLEGGVPGQFSYQFFEMFGRSTSFTTIRYEGTIPGSYAYQGLLSPGSYGLSYLADSNNFQDAMLPPIAASTRGGFSLQLTPVVQGVPEPTGLALFALGLIGLLVNRKNDLLVP